MKFHEPIITGETVQTWREQNLLLVKFSIGCDRTNDDGVEAESSGMVDFEVFVKHDPTDSLEEIQAKARAEAISLLDWVRAAL